MSTLSKNVGKNGLRYSEPHYKQVTPQGLETYLSHAVPTLLSVIADVSIPSHMIGFHHRDPSNPAWAVLTSSRLPKLLYHVGGELWFPRSDLVRPIFEDFVLKKSVFIIFNIKHILLLRKQLLKLWNFKL